MYNNQLFYCPYCMYQNTCPFLKQHREYNPYNDNFNGNVDLYGGFRAPHQDVDRIFRQLEKDQPHLFREFRRYGVDETIINHYLKIDISYTLDNLSKYTGALNRRINAIFNDFRRKHSAIFTTLRTMGVPNSISNRVFRDIMEFILRNTDAPYVSESGL